jgi:hypothetical protein
MILSTTYITGKMTRRGKGLEEHAWYLPVSAI